jgi:hypothetical protein
MFRTFAVVFDENYPPNQPPDGAIQPKAPLSASSTQKGQPLRNNTAAANRSAPSTATSATGCSQPYGDHGASPTSLVVASTAASTTGPYSQPGTAARQSSDAPAAVPTVGLPIIKPPTLSAPIPRRSSPLGPRRRRLPCRPMFPPSTPEPNLYRKALLRSSVRRRGGLKYLCKDKEHAKPCVCLINEPKDVVVD